MICSLRWLSFIINIFLVVSGGLLIWLVLIFGYFCEGNIIVITFMCIFGVINLLFSPIGICAVCNRNEKCLRVYSVFMLSAVLILLASLIPWLCVQKQTSCASDGKHETFKLAAGLAFVMCAVDVIGTIISVPLYCKFKMQNAARRSSSTGIKLIMCCK